MLKGPKKSAMLCIIISIIIGVSGCANTKNSGEVSFSQELDNSIEQSEKSEKTQNVEEESQEFHDRVNRINKNDYTNPIGTYICTTEDYPIHMAVDNYEDGKYIISIFIYNEDMTLYKINITGIGTWDADNYVMYYDYGEVRPGDYYEDTDTYEDEFYKETSGRLEYDQVNSGIFWYDDYFCSDDFGIGIFVRY